MAKDLWDLPLSTESPRAAEQYVLAVEKLLSATVIGHDLGYADALATALYVSGGELLKHLALLAGYHGFVVDGHGMIRASRGFPIQLEGVEALTA